MVTYTPILKLAKPVFDQTPWDQEINGDLNILDSAIGNFFGIANYIGLWRNGTAYVAGQVVTDAVDSSMWTCVISHTSAAGSTFAADRLANPSYWTKEIANATDLAQQAANSAAQAAASASAAAASAATINSAVPLAGGTMTGPLILSGDPTNVRGAATKQYVDARVGGTAFLPITGGALTGNLSVAGQLAVTEVCYLGAIVRAYKGASIPTIFGYHDAGGGAGFYVDSAGNLIFNSFDGGGGILSQRGYFSPAGGLHAVQQVTSPLLWSSGSIVWGGGACTLSSDANIGQIQFQTDGWRLTFQRTTGNLIYINPANAWLAWIDGGGGFHANAVNASGDIFGNGVYGNYIRSYGAANIDGAFAVGGTTSLSGLVTTNDIHTGAITTTNMQVNNNLTVANSLVVPGLITTTALKCNTNIQTATLGCDGQIITVSMTATNDIRSQNNLIAEVNGYKPGGGVWVALSDERIKTLQGAYTSSLAQLVQLEPVKYTYKDNHYLFDATYHPNTTQEHIGLIAQDAEVVMPELVKQVTGTIDGTQVSDFREMDGGALIYAVINALKEVSTRLDALEAARR